MTDYEKKCHERFLLVHCKGLLTELGLHFYDLKQDRLMGIVLDLQAEVGKLIKAHDERKQKEAK